MNAPRKKPRVNVEALETALRALLAHDILIEDALTAHAGGQPGDLGKVLAAVRHIIDDGFRSPIPTPRREPAGRVPAPLGSDCGAGRAAFCKFHPGVCDACRRISAGGGR